MGRSLHEVPLMPCWCSPVNHFGFSRIAKILLYWTDPKTSEDSGSNDWLRSIDTQGGT